MTDPYFYFNSETLHKLAREKSAAYATATPFPHIVIDDFLPQEVLDQVLAEFPGPKDIAWTHFKAAMENDKLASERDESMGPFTRQLMAQFNAAAFTSFLDTITGISGLIPDPYFRGGGLHQTLPGGSLGIHADFNQYKRLNLTRRVNALIYLNKDWKEEYGGHLELWNEDMTKCVQKVAPVFNRMVIFSTTDTAYHGHPDPLTCPPDRTRKSLALYYYTADQAAAKEAHTTLFRTRPGGERRVKRTPKQLLKACIPPILIDFWHAVRK